MSTITVQLPADTEERLRRLAERRGQTLEVYLRYIAEREADAADLLAQGIEWLRNRTAAEVLAARERILAASLPQRDPSPGQTVVDAVEGKWPGTETDAEIQAA